MSEHVKAVLSAVVIVACLALLGLMVYLKVDGAAVGALGTITVIIAWLTRAPTNPTPPGATLIPFVAAGALMVSLLACGCSASQQRAEIDLGLQATACIVSHINAPSFSQALAECGLENLTDPVKRGELEQLFTSARTGAEKAGATFSRDGGK